ncbi:sigma-54 dependent transcriptional regulator [Hydrogenophaga sp.]|uniref:sigma-54 dependent transcriptional regulator n=1 Tax=Hydrogenophaga sp. TaxID=1904254 RepID=UPI002FC851DD
MSARKILCLGLSEEATLVEDHLQRSGWVVVRCQDLPAARRLLALRRFDVALLVAGTGPRLDAADVAAMEACVHASSPTEWVALCGPGELESPAFRALILGSFFDYQVLPPEWRDLNRMLEHAEQRALLRNATIPPLSNGDTLGMVGQAEVMVKLRRQIRKVAETSAPVLICGESGSGKELAAQAIHVCSPRKGSPLVEVNCGAIAPSLIQSELFGYVRGAFTGATADRRGLIEAADGGTIFLDEVGDLPLELQANLLRFLQEKSIQRVGAVRSTAVDVRVIAASHIDLADAVAVGRFREDLFYRLNVLPIEVPPLRQRMEDVPLLAAHFLKICTAGQPHRVEGFSRQAVEAMAAHTWPGNVRELFNRVQRAVVMTEQRWIGAHDLGLQPADGTAGIDLDQARTAAERDVICRALMRVGSNITLAARELGVSRMTLYRLMDKHGIGNDPAVLAQRP